MKLLFENYAKKMANYGLVSIVLFLGISCSSGSGDSGDKPVDPFTTGETRSVEVKVGSIPSEPGSDIVVSVSSAEMGTPFPTVVLELTNSGNAPLNLKEVSLYSDPSGSYSLVAGDGLEMPTPSTPLVIDTIDGDGLHALHVTIMYNHQTTIPPPVGHLTIKSNANFPAGADTLTYTVIPEIGNPKISVSPTSLDFGVVSEGEQNHKVVNVLNTGESVLRISGFALLGHEGFSFVAGGKTWTQEEAAGSVELEDPVEVEPGISTPLTVLFEPLGPEPADGTLVLFSNDTAQAAGTVVEIQANVGGPCIIVNPKKVDFGGKLVGKSALVTVEITSCGNEALELLQVKLEDDSGDFSLDLSALGDIITEDEPVVLDVNESNTFDVIYVPDEINPLDGNGQPIPDLGLIKLVTNSFLKNVDIEVRGVGVEVECPTAVILVQEGDEVIPQTKLHLAGSQSYAAVGGIENYEWTVNQPVGSLSVFLPSATSPDPTFQANVAGTYIFHLRVWDQNGDESCVPAEYAVFVNPDEAIHVELLWDTPNDPEQTDEGPEAGADLDMHFLHPFATGEDIDGDGEPDGWFDQPFDCYWFNPHPNWASIDPMINDDPGLDRDDTDGAGPENVNLNVPQEGLVYKVGVHYWNDHGYGPSYATVRIYIYSTLVFQISDVELVGLDMWEVATIGWPSGQVDLILNSGGNYKIMPNYQHPFFIP